MIHNLKTKVLGKIIFLVLLFTLSAKSQDLSALKVTIPKAGKLHGGHPIGKGWANLLDSLSSWDMEQSFWKLDASGLHGSLGKEKNHHYAYFKKIYSDFELNVMIKMIGDENANSGVCVRIKPTDYDNAPGYQIDMGKGYWGSLWEERRASMVQKYPEDLAARVVKFNDWNHYYIVAKGHHIQAWLNGVKTIDIIHDAGFTEGQLGFQLCHMHNPTQVDIKTLYIRELKK